MLDLAIMKSTDNIHAGELPLIAKRVKEIDYKNSFWGKPNLNRV